MTWKENAADMTASALRKAVEDTAFAKDVLEARKQFVQRRLQQELEVLQLYRNLADKVKKQIGVSTSTLRNRQLNDLRKSLEQQVQQLAKRLEEVIDNNVKTGIQLGAMPHERQLYKRLIESKVDAELFNQAGLNRLMQVVNTRAVLALKTRTFGKNGLTVSDRVWNVAESNLRAITSIMEEAVATGQSAIDTARALEGYLKQKTLVSKTLQKRIPRLPSDITYQALRLARTEMTFAFAEGNYQAGKVNPGYRGIKWVLSHSHPEADICDKYAKTMEHGEVGFFPEGQEPMVPHPQ
jgi:hypothetical protein